MRGKWHISLGAALSGLAVVAVAVAAFGFMANSVDDQNAVLLKSDVDQAGTILQTAVSGVATSLESLAAVVGATRDSPSTFQTIARPLSAQPNTAVALIHSVSGQSTVVAAAGHGLAGGQVLPAPAAAAVAGAGPIVSASPVLTVAGKTVLLFMVAVAGVPGTAVVEQSVLTPYAASPATNGGPFSSIEIVLYATRVPRAGQLLITTTKSLPLTGAVARTSIPVGSSKWLLVGRAKSPLAGGLPNAAPGILLGAGVAVALLLAGTVEVISRRRRFAEELVAERTSQLADSQREVVRAARLSAVGEMATIIGHELRNPLAAVTNAHYLLRSSMGKDPVSTERHLSLAERESARAASLAEDLTAYMRERPPNKSSLVLSKVIDEILEVLPTPSGVTIERHQDQETLTVWADHEQLLRILTNLVSNAIQAMSAGGTVRITGRDDGTMTEVVVEDDGPGIDPASRDRIFEPFFTTKAGGTGLGLAIVQRLAEVHGGGITLENVSSGPNGDGPHGAVATLRLPHSEA
ncbi:MAG TPA: ATP-binding protein [Acidimicrobiales bacterium]|nr:ATP-binding protein [Acidimicrobiales bacterium]